MNELKELEVDEVSLVDAGANPEAHIVFFKRKTGYKKSRGWSRNIRFIITKDGENNGKHFVTNMPNGSQMVFSLGTFLLVKKADSRVFESGNRSGKPNRSSQIRRTALRHMPIGF